MTIRKPQTSGFWTFGFVVWICALLWLAPWPRPTPVEPIDPALARAQDLEKVIGFHVALVGIQNQYDELHRTFLKRWDLGAVQADFFGLYDAAQRYGAGMTDLKEKIEREPNTPTLTNAEAQQKLTMARGALFKAIETQVDASQTFMLIADQRDLRPSARAKLASFGNDTNGFHLIRAMSIAAAYQKLGVSFTDVDTKNGGLKTQAGENELKPAQP